MESTTIVALAQQGDEIAFAALFKQHRAKVYTRCLGMLRNPADAEDFTQEVFLKLHQTIGSFQGKSAFSTWLYKLTTNLVLMHLRSKDPVSASLDDIEREPADTRATADSVGTKDILSQLPIRLREVFRLRMVEGYSVNETADRLGIGPMAVVRRCSDAKEILREKLSPTRQEQTEVPVSPAQHVHPAVMVETRIRVLSTLPLC